MNHLISRKALRLMQNLLSLPEINIRVLPLDKKYGSFNDDHTRFFSAFDFYPLVYEESIALVVELAVIMRREIDSYCHFGFKYDFTKIQYSNIGKYCDSLKEISFYKALSKIIHADSIDFEVVDKNGHTGYGYSVGQDCYFSENILIMGRERDGSPYNALIDLKKFCINAFMMEAWHYG